MSPTSSTRSVSHIALRNTAGSPRPTTRPDTLTKSASRITGLIREQLDFRELLWAITRRDLALRYRNAVMGFGWAVAVPLLHMLVFSLIFTRVVRLDTEVPYPLFAFAGLLPWNLFASSLRFGATSLTVNPHLVTKVYFPREVLPFSTVLVSLVDGKGSVLAYEGPRKDSFTKTIHTDSAPMYAAMQGRKYAVGDFEFVQEARGSRFDACIKAGEGVYLLANNTFGSMAELRMDARWREAQKPFLALTEKFRADPVLASA